MLFLYINGLSAQETQQPLTSLSIFQEKLKQTAQDVYSIEADFTQEKFMEIFNEKIVSKGTFLFRKEDKICLDYHLPISYRMIINGNQLKITSEGKSNVISLGSNQMMNEMKSMLAACMTGDLILISDGYDTEYFETNATYIAHIRPKSKSVKGYITDMIITLDKKDMSVKTLRLVEPGSNYTEYIFTNRKYNTLTNDEKFTIH